MKMSLIQCNRLNQYQHISVILLITVLLQLVTCFWKKICIRYIFPFSCWYKFGRWSSNCKKFFPLGPKLIHTTLPLSVSGANNQYNLLLLGPQGNLWVSWQTMVNPNSHLYSLKLCYNQLINQIITFSKSIDRCDTYTHCNTVY